jgi:hypothetical protein
MGYDELVQRLRDDSARWADGDKVMCNAAANAIVKLQADLAAARAAQQFAGMILNEYADNWACDFTGDTLEDWAIKCGLIERIDTTGFADEQRCNNCDGECDYCHRYTDAAKAACKAALAALAGKDAPKS